LGSHENNYKQFGFKKKFKKESNENVNNSK
jgi:hypothetical protein